MAFPEPKPGIGADLDGSATFRANAIAAGLPANFVVLNPAVNGTTSPTAAPTAATTRFRSKSVVVCPRACRPAAATSGRLKVDRRSTVSCTAGPRPDRRTFVTRSRRSGTGRFQSAAVSDTGRTCNPWLDGVLGGWSFKGVSRIQARVLNFGQVRLVNMTPRTSRVYKFIDTVTSDWRRSRRFT